MPKCDILSGGKENALVLRDGQLGLLVYKTNTFFAIFDESLDPQIYQTTAKSIILSTYNSCGTRFVIVTNTGLLIFFCFDVKFGHVFTSESKTETITAIYKTMRVVFSDGKILTSRCALEDQYSHSVKECVPSQTGIILVPFDIVLCDHFAIVRVQPPESSSCLVRVVFDAVDTKLDGLPTRQALRSVDWQFVYDQGILHMSLFKGILLLLTHTCMVECWLIDHDPVPLITPLPEDRVHMTLNSNDYLNFDHSYRTYCQIPIDWKLPEPDNDDDNKTSLLVPPEWEVVLSTRPNARASVQQTIHERHKSRPSLSLPLATYFNVQIDTSSEDETTAQALHFSDTSPNAACPWRELQACDDGVYLLTSNELFFFRSSWTAFVDKKTNLPIYAKHMIVVSGLVLVLVGDDNVWTGYDHTGNKLVIPTINADAQIFAIYEDNNNYELINADGVFRWNT